MTRTEARDMVTGGKPPTVWPEHPDGLAVGSEGTLIEHHDRPANREPVQSSSRT
jgi:hypothetical protein